MKTHIGLTAEQRMGAARILNAVLATEYALYTATRGAHWNVVGPSFFELHKFFELQYETLDDIIDSVAERARAFARRCRRQCHARLRGVGLRSH